MARPASSRAWGDEDLWVSPRRSTRPRSAPAPAAPPSRALVAAATARAARVAPRDLAVVADLPATADAPEGEVPARGARGAGVPGRHTVTIRGQVAPPRRETARRRPARTPAERLGARPDRVALWAVLMGFFLILVAATSGHIV